jgi:hypothetical protein
MKGYVYMKTEEIIYDLAMIYAKERFHDSLKKMSEKQKIRYYDLINLLYQYFEDAYVSLHLMSEKYFDFSDIKKEK